MSKIVVKDFKALGQGWADIKVSTTKYSGGTAEYQGNENKKTAVFFTLTEAYVIEDNQGTYDTVDYMAMVKDKDNDLFTPYELDGVSVLAMVEGSEVCFNNEVLDRLGLNTTEYRQDIEVKLQRLSQLVERMDM